jgi:hypothetical protein
MTNEIELIAALERRAAAPTRRVTAGAVAVFRAALAEGRLATQGGENDGLRREDDGSATLTITVNCYGDKVQLELTEQEAAVLGVPSLETRDSLRAANQSRRIEREETDRKFFKEIDL